MTKFSKLLSAAFFVLFVLNSLNAVEITSSNANKYREKFINEVKSHIGSSYKIGATGPSNFDCSGLILYSALKATEIQLPRTASAQFRYVNVIPLSECEPGDLLFFRTTGSKDISHVGVYIGNNQFISALSDGANRGVSVSDLNSSYWKTRCVGAGQFLPAGKYNLFDNSNEKRVAKINESKKNTESNQLFFTETGLILDTNLLLGWNLLSPKGFSFHFRGPDVVLNARIADWNNQPGIHTGVFFDFGLGVVKIPVALSLTINNYLRAYAGPVFTIKTPFIDNPENEIRSSIFPGIIGLEVSTEKFTVGILDIQFVQDFSYTVYNKIDNSALSIGDSFMAGFVFNTGIRLSLPISNFKG